jgi:hypothetical protein
MRLSGKHGLRRSLQPILTGQSCHPAATNCQPGQGKKISKSGFLLGYYTKRSGPARRLEMFHRPVQSARIFRAAGMFDVGCFPHFSFSACQYFSIQLCVSAFQHFRSLLFRF